jgi:hypothetical protein
MIPSPPIHTHTHTHARKIRTAHRNFETVGIHITFTHTLKIQIPSLMVNYFDSLKEASKPHTHSSQKHETTSEGSHMLRCSQVGDQGGNFWERKI